MLELIIGFILVQYILGFIVLRMLITRQRIENIAEIMLILLLLGVPGVPLIITAGAIITLTCNKTDTHESDLIDKIFFIKRDE